MLNINPHVERLRAYQPFDAYAPDLFAEYNSPDESDRLETRALDFVRERIDDPKVQLVVLTGDAGHGKTHLCIQLLSDLGESTESPSKRLEDLGSAEAKAGVLPDGRDLYIIKDLSEWTDQHSSALLEASLSSPDRVTLVCANEGKLRKVLEEAPENTQPIRQALEGVLERGLTSQEDGRVHVVDLNHQSVAARNGNSLVRQALNNWAVDAERWEACANCDARESCPIFENHRLLADGGSPGQSRRNGVETLLRLIEETGHVITIRELLAFMARGITGGLHCTEVHKKYRSESSNWQGQHLFHQVMFGTLLTDAQRNESRTFRAASMLDPAARAIRQVDDALAAESELNSPSRFQPSSLGETSRAKTASQRQNLGAHYRKTYAFLRRREYFDSETETNLAQVSFAERLGLRFYDQFEKILATDADDSTVGHIRDEVLAGIEAVQGARRSSTDGRFLVVDPAFSSTGGSAAVISRRMRISTVRLISQSEWWNLLSDQGPNLQDAVDWLDRQVFVLLEEGSDKKQQSDERRKPVALELNCRQFEFVRRSAEGLTNRAFFQADVRRVMSKVAAVAKPPAAEDEIKVLFDGQLRELMIDQGHGDQGVVRVVD